jgi:hypothetical protein
MLLIDPKYIAAARDASNADDLHGLLQSAIQLEHATIPPYLTAAYSLQFGINTGIRSAIVNMASFKGPEFSVRKRRMWTTWTRRRSTDTGCMIQKAFCRA